MAQVLRSNDGESSPHHEKDRLEQAKDYLASLRDGTAFHDRRMVMWVRDALKDANARPEAIGTTEEELSSFDK